MTVTSPSQPAPTPLPERPSGPSLSPSRAADFKTCPQLFRFRTIDRLPERPSADQVRGTLVHAVLERLFDLPAAGRTPDAAAGLVAPEWARLVREEPTLADLFADEPSPAGASALPLGSGVAPVPAADAPAATSPAAAVPDGLSTTGPAAAGHTPAAASATEGLSGATAVPSAAEGVPDSLSTAGPAAAGHTLTVPSAAEGVLDGLSGAAGNAPATGASLPSSAGAESAQAMLDGMPGDESARLAAFLRGAGELLNGYFAVEDPSRLEPAERETLISTLVDDELLIRGYIDRLDVSPAGDLRVVDYKTGGAPREAFEGRALFQLKFYALVLWRTRGVVPKVLRLLYLKDAEILDYQPDAEELERFERTLLALSQAIERAKRDRDFRPKPSRLCGWCSHQAFCPEFGGTPPPYPEPSPETPPATVLIPAPGRPLDADPAGRAETPGSPAEG